MPRRAHRRCKEQGPTCNGITHPGYEICSRCLIDVVRPKQREERAEVKRRKAAKLQPLAPTLAGVGVLGRSGQQPGGTQVWLSGTDKPVPPARTIGQAIGQLEVDRQLEGIPSGKPKLEALMDIIVKDELKNTPVDIKPHVPARYRQPAWRKRYEEEPVPEAPVQEPSSPPTNGRRHRPSKLTPEQVEEILEAFKSDISTSEIQSAYGIGAQTLYTLVRRAGLPLRGQKRRIPEEAAVPEPVKTSTPVSDMPDVIISGNGVASDLSEWVVTYEVVKTETVTVVAKDFNTAAAAVDQILGVTVVSVARKR